MANTDKLPVWGIMILTYRFFWAERRQFWLLAVPAIIVVSMLSALAEWSVARAAANNEPMCSTVSFSVTLSPTTPHVTPSGLRKSFCGSVISSAV